MAPADIDIRRVYDSRRGDKGTYRVLVDRLWPRGIAKDALSLDSWARDVAPSTELRRWYGHDPRRFEEFSRRYLDELHHAPARNAVTDLLNAAAGRSTIMLLTATRDVEHSGAQVLARHLRRRARSRG